MKALIDSKHGFYVLALLAGLIVYIIDITILGLMGAIAPTFATWADEMLLLVSIAGLCIWAYKANKAAWQAAPIIMLGLLGFSMLPALGVALTIDTYQAKVTTAGLDESEKGKKTIFTAKIVPADSKIEVEDTHRAQDATILFPAYWWKYSSDTRIALKEAKNTQTTVCITSYGIRSGMFSQFPNVVEVRPAAECN